MDELESRIWVAAMTFVLLLEDEATFNREWDRILSYLQLCHQSRDMAAWAWLQEHKDELGIAGRYPGL